MQIVADLHTHTIASSHAYSSLAEMARGAHHKGLLAIGITDHGSNMKDAPHPWHFSNLKVIPRDIGGVKVIRGIEFNILPGGKVDDIIPHHLRFVEFALASFHETCYEPGTKSEHTEALEAILADERVNALGHPGNPHYEFDMEYIIPKCAQCGKLVEINGSSFSVRTGSEKNCMEIARLCKKYEVPIVVNSDAHIEFAVGNVSESLAMLDEIGFPEELVVNSSRERLDTYFRSRGINIFD